MNYSNITQAYQNAERQALEETNDPHLIIMTMLDALVKSMQIFVDNIDLKNGGDAEMKSKHFSRAISIIYALQSSLDFEKGGDIANNLFQLYEYGRVKLIEDLGKGVANKTPQAIEVIASIRDAWEEMGKQVSDEK
jgi:flagellar protein FliS